MNTITSIENLISSLESNEVKSYPKILKSIHFDDRVLEVFQTWEYKGYTRNCLANNEKFELILLCWDGHSNTPIHNHGGEECWVYQLQGSLIEKRFDSGEDDSNLKQVEDLKLSPGKLTYMNDRLGYHSIENQSDQRAMTLHLYASPIKVCQVLNPKNQEFENKLLTYDTNHNKSLVVSI